MERSKVIQWKVGVFLCMQDVSHTTVSTVLTVLRYISKGHRDIRRFLKNKVNLANMYRYGLTRN